MDENAAVEDVAEEYSLLGAGGLNHRQKRAKGNTKTDLALYLKFLVFLCVIMAYFL